ncbi:hypothetical protein J6590_093148, partial [Homalodisca vitripennis]
MERCKQNCERDTTHTADKDTRWCWSNSIPQPSAGVGAPPGLYCSEIYFCAGFVLGLSIRSRSYSSYGPKDDQEPVVDGGSLRDDQRAHGCSQLGLAKYCLLPELLGQHPPHHLGQGVAP